MTVRVRFAPSPTGFFHVGGARTALQNWLSPSSTAARSSCASRTPTRPATARSGPRGSSTRWPGSASSGTATRGRTSSRDTPTQHRAAARRLLRRRAARTTATAPASESIARTRATPAPGYDGFCRDRGLEPGPGRALRFRTPARGRDRGRRPGPRQADVRQRADRGLRHRCAATARRCSCWPTSSTTWTMGITHVDAGRGAPAQHAQAAAAVGGARAPSRRCGPTCRCSSTRSARSCRSGATRWRSRRYRDEGYLADGHAQLPDDAGLGAERRPGDRAVVRRSSTSSASRTSTRRPRSST